MKATETHKTQMKNWYIRNKEQHLERVRSWAQANKARIATTKKLYRENNKEIIIARKKLWAKAHREKMKDLIINHYSSNSRKCKFCGFNDIRALSIDHINGGGAQHRKQTMGNLYNWLKQNNFPKGYQVLCMNCQWIKRAERGEVSNGKGTDN